MKPTEPNLEHIHEYNLDYFGRQIFLNDGLEKEINANVSNMFIKNMSILEHNQQAICIHLHSLGGDLDAGMAIYDRIACSKCHITIICYGSVMSMASAILQAADERISMPNCIFMLHEGSSFIDGTHKQVQSWSSTNQQQQQKLVNIYATRCVDGPFFADKHHSLSKTKTYIKTMFSKKEDWYLTTEEALDYGVIDSIVGNGNKYETIKDILNASRT